MDSNESQEEVSKSPLTPGGGYPSHMPKSSKDIGDIQAAAPDLSQQPDRSEQRPINDITNSMSRFGKF